MSGYRPDRQRLIFKSFAISIRLADGSCTQQIVSETSSKRALGQAFRELRADGLEPAAERPIALCKTGAEMTRDERAYWGLQSAEDRIAEARENREGMARAWRNLDLY